jgi:FkbM family methyltransferase
VITRIATAVKAVTPAALWPFVRSAAYSAVASVPAPIRFYRSYIAGWFFDLSGDIYRSDGMSFRIPRHLTTRIVRGRFHADTHERAQRLLIDRHLPSDGKVLELGACLGIVSCFINRKLDEGRDHIVVEANPHLIEVIVENRDRNGCRFAIEHCLVSRTSDGSFYLSGNVLLSSASERTSTLVRVPVQTVEQLQEKNCIEVDTLFMDIQGGELEFLSQNRKLLSRCRCVILELHPATIGQEGCDRCRRMLADVGLAFVEKQGASEAWIRHAGFSPARISMTRAGAKAEPGGTDCVSTGSEAPGGT